MSGHKTGLGKYLSQQMEHYIKDFNYYFYFVLYVNSFEQNFSLDYLIYVSSC